MAKQVVFYLLAHGKEISNRKMDAFFSEILTHIKVGLIVFKLRLSCILVPIFYEKNIYRKKTQKKQNKTKSMKPKLSKTLDMNQLKTNLSSNLICIDLKLEL